MYKNILVPLDGSDLAEQVLSHVSTVAKGCEDPNIILLRVVEPIVKPYTEGINAVTMEQLATVEGNEKINAEKYLKKVAGTLAASGMKTTTKVLRGKAADMVVEYVNENNIDLVIFSTHGRSGLSKLLWGSVADRVLQSVCVPVFMVRSSGCGMSYKS